MHRECWVSQRVEPFLTPPLWSCCSPEARRLQTRKSATAGSRPGARLHGRFGSLGERANLEMLSTKGVPKLQPILKYMNQVCKVKYLPPRRFQRAEPTPEGRHLEALRAVLCSLFLNTDQGRGAHTSFFFFFLSGDKLAKSLAHEVRNLALVLSSAWRDPNHISHLPREGPNQRG